MDESQRLGMLLPLRQARLPDQVDEPLLLQIARGIYRAGSRLPSAQPCADFGVSRPVVREALARLRLSNIVRSHRGSGSWVEREPSDAFARIAPSGSIAEMVHSYEFRAGIEAEAAALAAQRPDGKDLQVMARATEALALALQKNEIGAEADIDFNRAVAAASRNSLFTQAIETLHGAICNGITVACRLKQESISDRINQVLVEHGAVLLASRGRGQEGARDAHAPPHYLLARSHARLRDRLTLRVIPGGLQQASIHSTCWARGFN